jgi:hypothetical protein
MMLFTNRGLNRLAAHSTTHQLAWPISSAFSAVFLMWRGLSVTRRVTVEGRFVPITATGSPLRQSEFDKIIAALGRAEFALEEFRKRADELRRKSDLAKSIEEIAALNLEAAELLQLLVKMNTAVHTGNPAPHLWLVSDAE